MSTPDIRKGDLVKATLKSDRTVTVTDHVFDATTRHVESDRFVLYRDDFDFEVLDRPLPPIDEELIRGAVTAYFRGESYPNLNLDSFLVKDLKAVINFVREYDSKNATKENA